jgi:hypothetical protein
MSGCRIRASGIEGSANKMAANDDGDAGDAGLATGTCMAPPPHHPHEHRPSVRILLSQSISSSAKAVLPRLSDTSRCRTTWHRWF